MNLPSSDRDEASARLLENFARVETQGSRALLLTGRRGTGKTSLVTRVFGAGSAPFLYRYANPLMTARDNVHAFWRDNAEALGLSETEAAFPSLAALLRFVLGRSDSRTTVLFVDECQNLGTIEPDFFARWRRNWAELRGNTKMLLIFVGSDGAALRSLLSNSDAELFFGNVDRLTLSPFSFGAMKRFLSERRSDSLPEDWLTMWFLTGGVPHYVETLLEAGALDADAMLRFALAPDGFFVREGEKILREEFCAESAVYFETLAAIAVGKGRRCDLAASLQKRSVGRRLCRLEHHFRLIRREEPLGGVANDQGCRFGLKDRFLIFWFGFVLPNRCLFERGNAERLVAKARALLPDLLFGPVLRDAWKETLLESGEYAEVGSWWDRRGENGVDVVATNPAGKVILFGEVKRDRGDGDEGRLRLRACPFLAQNPRHADYEPRFVCLTPEDL